MTEVLQQMRTGSSGRSDQEGEAQEWSFMQELTSCGEGERKASHLFSYISQAVSSNARPSSKSERLVTTDTHTGWKTRSHSKKQAPA